MTKLHFLKIEKKIDLKSANKNNCIKLNKMTDAQAIKINLNTRRGVWWNKSNISELRNGKCKIPKEYFWNEIVCYFVREGSLFIRTKCVWNADDTALTGDGYSYKIGFDDVATGDCVRKSAELYLKMRKLGGVKLIQGEVWSRAGEYKPYNKLLGCPIFHSWVEWNGMVYDYSQNKRIVCDWDIFYAMMRVKKTIEVVPEIKNDKLVVSEFKDYVVKKDKKGKERRVLEDFNTYFGLGEQTKMRQAFVSEIKRKQRSVGLWSDW